MSRIKNRKSVSENRVAKQNDVTRDNLQNLRPLPLFVDEIEAQQLISVSQPLGYYEAIGDFK